MTQRDDVKKYKNIKLFTHNGMFLERVSKIRRSQGIPIKGFSGDIGKNSKYYKWFVLQARKRLEIYRGIRKSELLIENEISQLLEDMKYGKEWAKIAYDTIVFGKLRNNNYTVLRSTSTIPNISPLIQSDGKEITVTIYPNTLRNDYFKAWKEINKQRKTLSNYDKSRNRRTLERDMLMIEFEKTLTPKESYFELSSQLPDDDTNIDSALKQSRRVKKILRDNKK